ncbi:hypothetical protein NHQ30_001230 [Ciborinia camelliae]|nr:hypothetical protein NHQ30_001230 [Ciborinia camelliae]
MVSEALMRADGTIVCKVHFRIICHDCSRDYSVAKELHDEEKGVEEEGDGDGEEKREVKEEEYDTETAEEDLDSDTDENSGDKNRPFPDGFIACYGPDDFPRSDRPPESDSILTMTEFTPPNLTDKPGKLFSIGELYLDFPRLVRRTNPHEILIYADGACLRNGISNPTAGWGFVISPTHKVSFRLENTGPTGEPHPQTSTRAKLRAVIAVLEYRLWQGETCTSLVIATDSEYVVQGATKWIHTWIQQGWRTSSGEPVENHDLWKRLIYCIKRLNIPLEVPSYQVSTSVSFWKIRRGWNKAADKQAKKGAKGEEVPEYQKLEGVCC